MNIGSLLPRHARFRPDHLALVVGDSRLSYRRLNARVNALGNALLAAGIGKGQKLAAVLPNCLELMLLYWTAAKTGIVIVPTSPLLQAAGLRSILSDSDTEIVFADASLADALDSVRDDLPAIDRDRFILVGPGADRPAFTNYESFVAGASEDEPPDAGLGDDDVYNIMYTSGTTGAPKGIVHTHYVRANYCTQFAAAWRMTPESVVLHAGSIVFNGAMLDLMPWMYVGASYILHEAFDPAAVIRDVEAETVTHMVFVPSQIIALLDHPDFDPAKFSSLEMIQNVGAPLLLEHKRRLMEALPGRYYELYGLTEGFVTILDKTDALRKEGSVGCPPPFFEMRILDQNGAECGPGETGEICGRGPILMSGYYKRQDLTEQAIVDGWLHSGDLGHVDEDGYLYLVDRIKDMIISGGVNVYPKDIEEVVVEHPDVSEAAVFGIPDQKWGEVPIAAVTLRAGSAVGAQELIAWTNARVGAKYQRVKDCWIRESFPRNVAGKTLKREMRAEFIETRSRNAAGAGETP